MARSNGQQKVLGDVLGSDVAPPRRGAVLVFAVDSTARAYDLTTLALAGELPAEGQFVVVALQASTASVHYHFSPTNVASLDHAATIAAGGAVAYADAYGIELPAGAVHQIRIDRTVDSYLVMKTSTGTATCRVWAASEAL
jgi:hypothetical protein